MTITKENWSSLYNVTIPCIYVKSLLPKLKALSWSTSSFDHLCLCPHWGMLRHACNPHVQDRKPETEVRAVLRGCAIKSTMQLELSAFICWAAFSSPTEIPKHINKFIWHFSEMKNNNVYLREKKYFTFFSSVQFSSVSQSCPTLCDPMNRTTPGLPVHQQLPEFTQTHIHRVSDAIQPSHPLLSPSPPAPNPSQHQSLFQQVNSLHEVAKVLEFQL